MDEHSREALYAARRQIRKILSENGKRVNLGRLPFIPDEVSELTGLVEFVISGPDISDLTPIRKQNGLHSLSIAGTGVADLEEIESFPELTHLKLDSTEIVDLTPIANLRKLKVLSFGQTKVTDLSPLAELSELEELYFANTGATDLSPLSGSKKLSRLYLNDTAVTDLSPLIGLKRIKTLNLSNTRVEDLRPVLDIGVFTTKPEGLFFERTPITRKDDELNYLSKLMDSHELVKDVIAHLKTLPPWPEPLSSEDEASKAPDSQTQPRIERVEPPLTSKPAAIKTDSAQIRLLLSQPRLTQLTASMVAAQIRWALADVKRTTNSLPEPLATIEEIADALDGVGDMPLSTKRQQQEQDLRLRIAHLEAVIEKLTAQLKDANKAKETAEALARSQSFSGTLGPSMAAETAKTIGFVARVGVVSAAIYFLGATNPVIAAMLGALAALK